MSADPIKTPNRRVLWVAGAAGLAVACAIVVRGMESRADTQRALVQWTNNAAVPTVQLARIERGAAEEGLTLPGTIQPYFKAPIYARVSGYLKSWQEDIGAHVKAGQLLATIDTPDLDQQFEQAKANLATAQANEQVAAVTAQRWQALVGSQWVSKQANDEKAGAAAADKAIADAAQANVGQLQAMEDFKTIVAPFDGIVTQRNTDVGALVNIGSGANAGMPLFEVSDLHKVRIYVQAPQAFTGDLEPGLHATFDLPQYPGRKFEATVAAISHAMDMGSRSMMIELQADNPDGALAQGAYAQVHFELPVAPNMVRAPATALIPTNRGVRVAVLGDDGKAVMKEVQLGRDFGDQVEIVAGLDPQDRVIDSPPETLQDGDEVRLASGAASSKSAQAGLPAPAVKAD
ncbi:MAG: efflux RND transporter periplasmic adaptor subunit [Hyphomicrobiales bacterium]|nr:efflux RND transporter periplasmic adaptor subunit [Hyphomicrobiales bacterium]MBV8662151.1 efflux RND transporter periplasmic adaptor subunit [Hyphomicrobiales bacterium]